MTDRSAYDPFSPPPAAPVELTERAALAISPIPVARALGIDYEPTHAEHVAFIASELEAGLARKGIDV